jgi:hypothetical protein
MKGIIFIIISLCFVCIGIIIQTKILKKHHPNAELLIKLLHLLGTHNHTTATGNINNEKN